MKLDDKHDDKVTGWTFECPTDSSGKPRDGGLVLQNVRHHGHNFAKDIRLIGVRIETRLFEPWGSVLAGGDDDELFFALGSKHFTVSPARKLKPAPILNHPTWRAKFEWLEEFDDALSFSDYIQDPEGTYSGYGVTAKYEAPNLFAHLKNCQYAGLSIEQVFLFSRYSDQPPHEPTGLVDAARCHPLVRFQFHPNKDFAEGKRRRLIHSIRFDFRLHLYLDRHHDVAENAKLEQIGNQAGLFADRDGRDLSGQGISKASFRAVEKPLVYEVMAPGLLTGRSVGLDLNRSGGSEGFLRCWDNIHWWGADSNPATWRSLPATPGAFHAAHIHWRWGKAIGVFGGDLAEYTWPIIDTGPHFAPGVALVDPAIAMQTIRIAVTENSEWGDPERIPPLNLSRRDWYSLFENTYFPGAIEGGADIVLWYSAEVHSHFIAAPSGTVFVHGMFFAHDPGDTGPTVGSTGPLYWNNSHWDITNRKKWFRPAD